MRQELWKCVRRIPWRRRISPGRLIVAIVCALAAYFLFCIAFGVAAGVLIRICGIEDGELLQTIAVVVGIFGQIPAGAVLLLFCFTAAPAGRLFAAKLGIRPLSLRDGKVIAACVAANLLLCGPVTWIWELLLKSCGIPYSEEQDLSRLIAESSPLQLGFLLFGAVLIAPVVEEIGFRRVLFGALRPLGAWPAVLLTCTLFSLVHCFLLGVPGLFLLGFLFQYTYLRTRNLSAAVLLHMAVNLIATAAAIIEPLLG